ncbi:MAG: acyl-CoA thioesterase [Ketobacteraceae bacterium]|nr:acyl-CoA thioesterase [Ketobacteraceae bacterium]
MTDDMDDSQNDRNEEMPTPLGELALQTVAMPADTNADGDVFGGWLVSQMDLAGAVTANRLAKGRVATVAIDTMVFLRPVAVGSTVSCYTKVLEIGRSSIAINVEVWAQHPTDYETRKVTEGRFTFVAIDQNRRTRPVPRH